MSRTSTLILLGILIIITPFSGLPIAVRTLLVVMLGACVAGIGLSLRQHEARSAQALAEPTPSSEPVPPQTVSPI